MKPWRVAIGYVLCSALAVALVAIPMVPIWQTWFGNITDFRSYVEKTTHALTELSKREGPAAVSAAVRSEAGALADSRFIVFADPGKKVLAGTLRQWPEAVPDAAGELRLTIHLGAESSTPVIAMHVIMPGGYHLLIGRKIVRTAMIEKQLVYGVAGAFAILILIGAAVAWLLIRRAQALRLSDDRYERVMLAARAGFWEWDVLNDEFHVSPRFLEMCELPLDTTFSGRADFMRRAPFHPEDREKWQQAVKQLFASGGIRLVMDIRSMRKDGHFDWRKLEGMCFRDAIGNVVRWTGSSTDITEQKRAEEALRGSERRYALAMEAAGDGHTDWNLATGEFYISPRLLRILGHPPDATFADRADWVRRFPFHPEDRKRWEASVAAHFAGNEAKFSMDLRIVVNGETRWTAFTFIAVRDEAGKVVRWTGSIADITQRKVAAEALHESEDRFARAVAGSAEGVWDIDLIAGTVYFSARTRELCGLPPGPEVAPLDGWFEALPLHPEDMPRRFATVQAHLSGKAPAYDGEFRFRQPDGVYRWRHLHGVCVRDASGKPLRMAGSISDVDARRRAEEDLRLSEERYALAMEASEEGHFDWNVRTDEIFVSARMKKLLDLPADAEYRTWEEMFAQVAYYPGERERVAEVTRQVIASDAQQHELEYRVMRGKEVRWLRRSLKIVRDATGAALRAVGALIDITARRHAEDELRASEARFRGLTALWSDWYWRQDEHLRFNYSSAAADPPAGYPGGSAIGKTRWELPDIVPLSMTWVEHRELLAAHKSFRDFEYSRPNLSDGTIRYISTSGTPIFDESGEFRGYHGVARDITERKRIEAALREQTERLQLGQAAMRMIIMDWNVAEDLLTWSDSPEWLRGPKPEGGGYPSFKDQVYTEDRDRFVASRRRALESLEVQTTEFRLVRTDGEMIWLLERKHALAGADGKAVRMLAAMFDITDRKRAEEALRESTLRYERVTMASNAGLWDWDVETDEFYASPRYLEMCGFPAGTTFAGRMDFMRRAPYHPEDRERWMQKVQQLFESGDSQVAMEEERVLVGGETRWIFVNGICFRDATGRVVRWTGSATDITDRKRAEEALRLSEERYALAMQASGEGHWDWNIQSGEFYVSPRMLAIVGYPPDAVFTGREDWVQRLPFHPEGRRAYDAAVAAHFAGETPSLDLTARIMLGEEQRWLHIIGTCVRDSSGNPVRWVGSASDITPRRRAEEALRSRQEMLDLAQKSARVIAFEWKIGESESDNRWSPDLEAMYGLAPGTYDGSFEQWKDLVHPDDRQEVMEAIDHARRTGEVSSEYRVVHPDGSEHWLQAKGRMLFNTDGIPTRMVGFMQDITQRKHAEEEMGKLEAQLRQAQRLEAMGTMAGGIAHDFNNILGAIIGYGEMALRGAKKDTRLRRDLDAIMSAGERGRALVDRILAFSRSAVGERLPVHVEAVVNEALHQLGAKLPENVTIAPPRLRADRAAMLGDSTQVHQVVMNLTNNGVQAMPQGGALRVSLETVRFDAARSCTVGTVRPEDYIVLKVSDAGTGIAPEVIEHMFDPFFTTKEVGVGSGLGLSLVHGIVVNVGGAIDVATELGKGSTFTVYFPRSGEAAKSNLDEDQPLPRGDGERVLIVDDEEPLVRLAGDTLKELGYIPIAFTSSTRALEAFDANPKDFDAILTDERMPGASGSALIREVRRISPSIPIVLMSGFINTAAALKAREMGANDVLRKPLLARDLAASLARVLHL